MPSDPGDWVTQAELSQRGGPLFRCTGAPENSSWHGTQVSALIAARTNDGVGMAGAAPGVRVLPVRVLGKCGGYDSDIIAGMRWAAGLAVPGAARQPPPGAGHQPEPGRRAGRARPPTGRRSTRSWPPAR